MFNNAHDAPIGHQNLSGATLQALLFHRVKKPAKVIPDAFPLLQVDVVAFYTLSTDGLLIVVLAVFDLLLYRLAHPQPAGDVFQGVPVLASFASVILLEYTIR